MLKLIPCLLSIIYQYNLLFIVIIDIKNNKKSIIYLVKSKNLSKLS